MKWFKGLLAALVAVAIFGASAASAQDLTDREKAEMSNKVSIEKWSNWGIGFGSGIGAGVTIIGAAFGISQIAGRAVESMARQPEVAGNIQGAMIIAAALIEGVTFLALIVCLLILFIGG